MLQWIVAVACLLGATDVQVQTIEGEAIVGQLKSLDAQQMVVTAADGDRTLSVGDVLQLTHQRGAQPAVRAPRQFAIELADGSQLYASGLTATGSKATVRLEEQQSVELPQKLLRTLRVAAATDAELEQWRQIVEGAVAGDQLVVRKQGTIDHVEGVVQDITADAVQFELDGEVVPVKWNKIFGLIYHHRGDDSTAEAQCLVHLADGSRLVAESLATAGDQLKIELVAGSQIEVPLSAVERLDYSQGKVVYLSDLPWDARESRRTPYLGPSLPLDSDLDVFSPQRDRAFDGGPLRVGGKSYAKGLALHSRTRLAYRLPEGYRRLVALAGIDEQVGSRGHVALRIEGDGNLLFATELAGGQEPAPIDLDIAGVRRLVVLVDYGNDRDTSDHLDLCEAKLIK